MSAAAKTPAELRNMFGANLRSLSKDYVSVSELSRQLGINRTQFNRYLAGESFPRPDVLARICGFFKVDARMLLEPVENITSFDDPMTGPFLRDFVGRGAKDIPESTFPNGFYRFSRRSFMDTSQFVVGLVFVKRAGQTTYIRGYEAREAMKNQALPSQRSASEFRGVVMQQEEGIAALISRRNSMTCSFNYLDRVTSFENNFWVGYVARTMRESMTGERAVRMVYEHLGNEIPKAMNAARNSGYCSGEDLIPFHKRLLSTEVPFR
jgi:transcriptional regulator with XRE-family HTH domain